MSNIKDRGKRGRGEEGKGAAPRPKHPFTLFNVSPFTLMLVAAFCLLSVGCRMDMQDQPKYKTYRAGDQKFGVRGASVRPPVEGTVPRRGAGAEYRDGDDYFYTGKTAGQAGSTPGGSASSSGGMQMGMSADASAGAAVASGAHVHGASETTAATGGPDVFPINIDEAALRTGRERFQIYCVVCHGFTGEGDGMIVRRGFRKPPSYYEDRLQEGTTPASHFFDVITNGWGAMPDYAAQIPPEDRWKIIAYIRALQLSRRVKFDELSPEARQKVLDSMHKPSGGHEGGSTELQSPQTGGTSSQVEGNH
jgi:mono/diheme cytochrome c family protein